MEERKWVKNVIREVINLSRMFEFINKTWNPLGGKCGFECSYCWAKALTKKYNFKKYQGEWYIDEKQINQKFSKDDFIFLQDMNDISFCPSNLMKILCDKIAEFPETKFLMLTKNPDFYMKHWRIIPENVVLGATIETNRHYPHISKAPPPQTRIDDMIRYYDQIALHPRFVSIEPIMDFDLEDFLNDLWNISPYAVAVGYDNYKNNLPEPLLWKTEELILRLENEGIEVYRKTIREPLISGERRDET